MIPFMLAAQLLAVGAHPVYSTDPPILRTSSYTAMAVGGTVGSAVGLGVGLLVAGPQRCDNDDVGCIVSRLGYAGVFTVAGATAGAVIGGKEGGDQPSVLGGVIGSVAGAVLGVGIWKLVDEAGSSTGGATAAVLFTVPQGLLAAAGAHLFGR